MKHFFTLLCGVFITLTSYSQTAKLSGKIVDEKGEGLIQANVVIDASRGWEDDPKMHEGKHHWNSEL